MKRKCGCGQEWGPGLDLLPTCLARWVGMLRWMSPSAILGTSSHSFPSFNNSSSGQGLLPSSSCTSNTMGTIRSRLRGARGRKLCLMLPLP